MSDEPRFPSPDEAPRKAESPFRSPPATAPAPPAPTGTLVTRAEAPPEEAGGPAGPRATKLTADEVRALLAVEGANRPSALGTVWKRGRLILLPTSVVSVVLHVVFGTAGAWAALALTLAVIVWSARPLFRRGDW